MLNNPLKEKSFFFCFGLPKSGTTFLQLILDGHPKIQCPSEVSFTYLLDEFPKMMATYHMWPSFPIIRDFLPKGPQNTCI